ncbi:MAG: hypothetical protein RL189_1423 [Pseudomonadota bacterium]
MGGLSESTETQQFAFFDVDGTVIERDSFRILMRELILKRAPIRLLPAAVLCFVLGILRVFSLVGKTQFKSALLWSATVGMSRKQALKTLRAVIFEKVHPLWFKEMDTELEKLRSQGLRICYVSASGEFWLRALLCHKDNGDKLIVGSKLMHFCGGLTLRGENCLGVEKIRRLRLIIPKDAVWTVAYSDHRADLPLLLASRNRVVVNPNTKNLKSFRKILGEQGFTQVQWTPVGVAAE